MNAPMTSPPAPEPVTCTKCNTIHDPTKCKAHSKLQQGSQCQLRPMTGQDVCGSHGGRAKQNKAAAAKRTTEVELRETLGRLTIVPVENPLQELKNLAGEAAAWKELCAEHVSRLERMRYGTEGGEAIRGEIQLFERAMDRCLAVLATIAKLNIDERLVRIAEAQKTMVIQAIEAALFAAGLAGPQVVEAKKVAARHLRAV